MQFVLTNGDTFDRIAFVVERTSQPAAVAQSVERRIGSAEVTGPIPVSSLIRKRKPNSRFPLFVYLPVSAPRLKTGLIFSFHQLPIRRCDLTRRKTVLVA